MIDISKMKWHNFLIAASLVFISGCLISSEPYIPVIYHDIGVPDKIETDALRLKIDNFRSDGAYRNKMLYRTSNCKVVVDEYNKWLLPPNVLVSRYLRVAFSKDSSDMKTPVYHLSGSLILFDIDIYKKKTLFMVNYRITNTKNDELVNRTFRFTKEYGEEKPENFAQAMSDSTGKLTEAIQEDLRLIKSLKK